MHCCDRMDSAINNWKVGCEHHDTPFECPNALVARFENGVYGIIYHDGGSSVNVIKFCPWCGTDIGMEKSEP